MTDDIDAKARETVHGLIQGYIGLDHKVIDMKAFYSALMQALKEAPQSRVLLIPATISSCGGANTGKLP